MDVKGCIYSSNILQGESPSKVKEVQTTPSSQNSQNMFMKGQTLLALSICEKTHCKRN